MAIGAYFVKWTIDNEGDEFKLKDIGYAFIGVMLWPAFFIWYMIDKKGDMILYKGKKKN